MSAWLDRRTALDRLGVRAQTLYAYVSRGRVGMRPDPADPRRSLYSADDIDALATRRARGRRSSAIAASAIAWGEPAIATAISTVAHGRPLYRGRDAVAFAERGTLEETAALLWGADDAVAFPSASCDDGAPAGGDRAGAFAALASLTARGRPTVGRSLAALRRDAAEAVSTLAHALGAAPGDGPVHARLARAHRLPADAPFRLFALGRSVGWAAHAIEQAGSGQVIRPRARYEGPRE